MTPEVSVVINNYNYGRFLAEAIDSALAQDEVRAEVIVVDDGSTDDSLQVVARFGDRVRLHAQKNAGQAAAINAGVALARGSILAFLDADDSWAPGKLAAVRDAFAQRPRAGLVYHRLQPVFDTGRPAFAPIPRTLLRGELAARLFRSGGRWPCPMTSAVSIRRETWDRAGAIPDGFRISADAWITGIAPLLAPVEVIPTVLGFYRIHDNTWYRAEDDPPMLRRRIAHWEATVAATNGFLDARGERRALRLRDHFAHQAAVARLGLCDAPGLPTLAWRGLTDRGEPHPLRRLRDTARAISQVLRDRRGQARSGEAA